MTASRTFLALPLLLALAACASAPRPAAPAVQEAAIAGTMAPLAEPAASEATTAYAELPAPPPTEAGDLPPPSDDGTPVAAPTEAEDDFAALYGTAPVSADAANGDAAATARPSYDPWEPMNRKIHAFNNVVDRAIARPLANAYVTVVPQQARLGVANFFDNLGSPLTFVNQVLQGRPRHAVQTLGRFVVNSTLGIGGIFDPASDLKMKRRSEDFGQTLGIWGWRSSRYVELPLFGPRTLRDVFGLVGDAPLSVSRTVEEDKVRIFLQGMQLVDRRAALLPLDAMRESAPDEYTMIRDAWLQRRTFQIEGDRRHRQMDEFELPDYLRDEERDPTVPADAMPLPLPGV
ncbi:MlaA family lipoprotein [Pseudoxanthomonas suwonensis]|uniref:Lipoprotein n=1 Tax=Pseudoxanthomonas suwonensis TaxID=314722 RepID=A0A0E3UN95_9GAMM|nr:VacJ family lipoprotein [Pseudoxanthomonas suwonensis]AKC86745.1 lipoprotein [Pseudoxanthomonas suwonensis]